VSVATHRNGSRITAPITLSRQDGPKPRSKRFLTTHDITDIVYRNEAGETTQQVGIRYGISKTRVADVLREPGHHHSPPGPER
jgi:hypothetical protein